MTSIYGSDVFVTGPKKVIDRMLEAVRRNVGDTIPVWINLSDLLDEECLKDSLLLEKRQAYEAENKELEYDDDTEKTGELIKVSEMGPDSTVHLQLGEEAYFEWISLEDVSRIYGVRIFEDIYDTVAPFEQFLSTTIIEPDGKTTKKTLIEPRHSLNQYEESFERLIELDPERYREIKIEAMEGLMDRIRYNIAEERVKLVVERAKKDNGNVFIPETVTDISRYDFGDLNIKAINVHPDNPVYCSEGNCLLSKDKTTVIVGCENSVVPESVKSIVPNAFAGCPCEPLMKKRYPATFTDIDSDLSDLF